VAMRVAVALFTVSLGGVGILMWLTLRLPAPPPHRAAGSCYTVPAFPDIEGVDWNAFHNAAPQELSREGSLEEKLRLAGTFSIYGAQGGHRRAIIDDLQAGKQQIVNEGDRIGGMIVRRILTDRVRILTESGVLQELRLTLVSAGTPGAVGGAAKAMSGGRFGIRRVGESRWTFDRKAVLAYYQELRDEPARLVQVFDSMVPVYGSEGKITGYRVSIVGEEELFGAAGLNEGDVVRRANAIDMSSRNRAEYLINEFLNNRANVFILDVERGGQPVQLRYEIR
jgi:type II secretory pathway component PulC